MYDPDIHHRRSIRLRDFNYSTDGAYFVTVCTQNRECLFGDICTGELVVNAAGRMVAKLWSRLPEKFPEIALGEYTIMPNHFHAVVFISNDMNHIGCRGESCIRPPLNCQGEHIEQGEHKVRPYGTSAGSVGRIVQAFKSMTTNAYIRGVKQTDWPPFSGRLWQRNYYERVIRDEKELANISEYIVINPARWGEDKENPDLNGI